MKTVQKSQSKYTLFLKIKNLKSAKVKAETIVDVIAQTGLNKKYFQRNILKFFKAKRTQAVEFLETTGVDNWDMSNDPLWARVQKEVKNIKKSSQLVIDFYEEKVLGSKDEQKRNNALLEQSNKSLFTLAKQINQELNFPQTVNGKISGNTYRVGSKEKLLGDVSIVLKKEVVTGYDHWRTNEVYPTIKEHLGRSVQREIFFGNRNLKRYGITPKDFGKKVTLLVDCNKKSNTLVIKKILKKG